MELPKDLKDKIWNYCRLNDITDLNGFMIKTLKKGFDIEVYGLLGETLNDGEKDLKTSGEREKRVEIEVIVEKRVEVPVEVIKEIEKIVEVPVEVIKEVEKIVEVEKVVTKVEYICDKESENEAKKMLCRHFQLFRGQERIMRVTSTTDFCCTSSPSLLSPT